MKRYLLFFILILIWMPEQALSYGVPLLLLGYLVFSKYQEIVLSRLLVIVVFFISYILFGLLIYSEYSIINSLLFIITFQSVIFFIVAPNKFCFELLTSKSVYNFIFRLTILEVLIGFVQISYGVISRGTFDVATGDIVQGTARLALSDGGGMETQLFYTNVLFSCFYLLTIYKVTRQKKYLYVVLLGFLIVLLSSVMHMTLMFFVSAGIAYVLLFFDFKSFFQNKYLLGSLSIVLFSMLLILSLQTSNLSKVPTWISRFSQLETPKTLIVKRYTQDILDENPSTAVFGLGPGQFSSRAALYRSGRYSNFDVFGVYRSKYFENYLGDFISYINNIDWSSSSMFPYYSWITVISELGVLAFLSIVIWLVMFTFQITRIVREKIKGVSLEAFLVLSGTLFLFFIGFQDNYWEMPHVVIFPMIILKHLHYSLKHTKGSVLLDKIRSSNFMLVKGV